MTPCGVAAFLPLAKPGAVCRGRRDAMPLHTLERYASGCCDGIHLSTGRVLSTRFFYSFFLFFRARTRGRSAKPLSMRVCGVFGVRSILTFSELSLTFSETA